MKAQAMNEVRPTGATPNLQWFINLFQSKYKKRIDKKIRELEISLLKTKMDISKVSQTLSPEYHCKLIIQKQFIVKDIELLKELL